MPEFRLLGPVGMLDDGGGRVELGPAKRRTLLAVLLLEPARPVPVDELVERIWGADPPPKARDTLYAHIARLRRTLATAGDPGPAIDRRPDGYLLDVAPDVVDLHRFGGLLANARALTGAERAERLREALDLWHGPPLADLSGRWVERIRATWTERHLAAVALWSRTELDLGHGARVVDRLDRLVRDEPLAEPLAAELIRALHVTGRGREALDRFARVRQFLLDELGSEPGPELRAAHDEVLQAGPPTDEPGRPAARMPADIPAFQGRRTELAGLVAPGTAISVVSGTAGVGKTALAVRWAHQVRDRFPDGQLYVDLRGFGAQPPVPVATALAGFLVALGVPGREIPLELEERAARYRAELAGRRVLVVLDNASSVEHVRPLLPESPSCRTVVTSRDPLDGLVALHGAHRLVLDVLPPDDAVGLLRSLLGRRVDVEPLATAALAEQCGRLPLALWVAAEQADTRPNVTLADLVAELTEHRRRAHLPAAPDLRAAVRVVFGWSYQRLPAQVARVFRLLGLHPGPDADAYATAALAGTALGPARQALDLLGRAHLIRPAGAGHIDMHDLLRGYARAQAEALDPVDEQQAALTRLFDYYVASSAEAMRVLHGDEAVVPALDAPTFLDAAAARDWLDRQRPALLAACRQASEQGRVSGARQAARLAATLDPYLDEGGHSAEALIMHSCALAAARTVGDRAGETAALAHLGVVHRRLGRYPEGFANLQQALAGFRALGDHHGEARTLGDLGVICELTGRHEEAERHHRDALALQR